MNTNFALLLVPFRLLQRLLSTSLVGTSRSIEPRKLCTHYRQRRNNSKTTKITAQSKCEGADMCMHCAQLLHRTKRNSETTLNTSAVCYERMGRVKLTFASYTLSVHSTLHAHGMDIGFEADIHNPPTGIRFLIKKGKAIHNCPLIHSMFEVFK